MLLKAGFLLTCLILLPEGIQLLVRPVEIFSTSLAAPSVFFGTWLGTRTMQFSFQQFDEKDRCNALVDKDRIKWKS